MLAKNNICMVKGPGHEMNIFLKGKIRVNVNVGGFWYKIIGSLADFCKHFEFKIVDSEPMKMVTGRIFGITVENNFIETSKNLTIKDHNSKLFKHFGNHHRIYKKR
jgi:hypothetical protein